MVEVIARLSRLPADRLETSVRSFNRGRAGASILQHLLGDRRTTAACSSVCRHLSPRVGAQRGPPLEQVPGHDYQLSRSAVARSWSSHRS